MDWLVVVGRTSARRSCLSSIFGANSVVELNFSVWP